MATRGSITVKHSDGKYHSVYTHWDSYLTHHGRILVNSYNSQELAEKLVAGGSISSLSDSCDLVDGHSHETPVKGYTVYYSRDRGETDQETVIKDTLQECLDINSNEYDYLYDGSWSCSKDGKTFYNITDDFINEDS